MTDLSERNPSPAKGAGVDFGYEYRAAEADDWDAILVLLSEAFNEEIGDEWSATNRLVFEPGRSLLATTPSGELAGMSTAYTRDLMTPGGRVPAAHVTMVAVSSTHRRRGIQRNMISLLHDDARRRAEPVAVLCATEGRIYQRFGYGNVQTALLSARLADAAAAGCDIAVVTTQPGSKSQQNVQRRGFDLLYTRAILVKRP